MKNFGLIILVALSGILFTGCEELLSEMGMNIQSEYYETEFVIPPTDAGEYSLAESMLTADVKDMLSDAGQDENSLINYISIKSATIEVMEESVVKDFSNMDEFHGFMSAENVGEDTIATVFNHGAAVDELTFDVTSVDVADYLAEEEFNYELKGVLNSPLTDTLKVKAKIKFQINIQALNAFASVE